MSTSANQTEKKFHICGGLNIPYRSQMDIWQNLTLPTNETKKHGDSTETFKFLNYSLNFSRSSVNTDKIINFKILKTVK